jgi:hypothetical protein
MAGENFFARPEKVWKRATKRGVSVPLTPPSRKLLGPEPPVVAPLKELHKEAKAAQN